MLEPSTTGEGIDRPPGLVFKIGPNRKKKQKSVVPYYYCSFPAAGLCLAGLMSLRIPMLFIAYQKNISAAAAGTAELPAEPLPNH